MNTDLAHSKILIVDDEPANVQLLEMLLGHGGLLNFRSTTDSRNVITLCREFEPDLIMLDLTMPYFDGFDVMAQLKDLIPQHSYVPILVLTAIVTPEAKRRALSAGANDFLTKPFDGGEVLLRTRNLLQTRHLHNELRVHNATLESTVKERTRELEDAFVELRAAQQQLIQQQRLQAFSIMAGGVAHDFNNVLSIVLGYGEVVLAECEKHSEREKEAQAMRAIITAAQDGAGMVTRLGEFYRPEDASLRPSLPVDFNVLAQQAVSLTEPLWKVQTLSRGTVIKLLIFECQGLPAVVGDPAELREVLTNLILNAVHAMPEGGTITLHIRGEAEDVILEVSDTGTGMTEDVRRRCLEPFFTTKGKSGTGLGLAMVYGIVQRHRGTLEIESELGMGTTFRLRFPASMLPDGKGETAEIEWARPLKILVVDDQEFIREILTLFLEEDCHMAKAVSNGIEALACVQLRHYDLLITDQAMPGMTGGQLAATVKKLSPSTRVILLTGFGAEDQSSQGRDSIDLVVGKPVTKETLRLAVAKAIAGCNALTGELEHSLICFPGSENLQY